MTTSVEAILDLIKLARGPRPFSFDDPEAEVVLNVALGLTVELAVANDRIERLEQAVAALSAQPVADWRVEAVAREDAGQRTEAAEAMMLRVLRIVLDPRTPVDGRP